MSNIDTINVGGLDYSIEDTTARDQATSAITVSAYVENGNTASRSYPTVGTPVNWKGSLYYTTATIAQGSTLAAGTNLAAAVNIGKMLSNIKTYVGSDSKLHFTDATGADSVLPFNNSQIGTPTAISLPYTATKKCVVSIAGTYPGGWNDGKTSRYGTVTITKNGSTMVTKTEYLNTEITEGVAIGIPFAIWTGILQPNDRVAISFSASGYAGATRSGAWVVTLE